MVFNYFRRRTNATKRRRFTRRRRPAYANNRLALRKNYYKPPSVFFFSRWARGQTFTRQIEDINDWPLDPSGRYRVIWKQFRYSFDALVGFEEFQALFRFYKIHKVVTRITFTWSDAITNADQQPQAQPPALSWRPWANWRAFSLIDKSNSRNWEDESNPPPPPINTLANAKQFNSFKMYHSMKSINLVSRPQAVAPVDNLSALFPAAQTPWKTWYLTNRPQINFFSLVFGVQPVVPDLNLPNKWRIGYTADTKYYFSLRGMQ